MGVTSTEYLRPIKHQDNNWADGRLISYCYAPLRGISVTSERYYQMNEEFDAFWLNHDSWVCRHHVPPIKYPAGASLCWFHKCATVRPPNRPEPVIKKPVPDLPPPRVKKSLLRPPPKARRRGATKAVKCSCCGRVIWRRPKEVRESVTNQWFCTKECRYKSPKH